jgi:hypothetical protein
MTRAEMVLRRAVRSIRPRNDQGRSLGQDQRRDAETESEKGQETRAIGRIARRLARLLHFSVG